MSRLIDADAYEKDMHDFQTGLNEWYAEAEDEDIKHRAESAIITLVEAKLRLKKQPTVDAVPVVHGKWVFSENDDMFYCTNCKDGSVRNDYPYCHWCGAMMDEVTK